MFREAFEAERERARLLQAQLQAAVNEKLGTTGAQMSVTMTEVPSPLVMGSRLTWREAYEAAKQRTADLEAQLSKTRGIGAQPFVPPPVSAEAVAAAPRDTAREIGMDRDEADALRDVGVTDDQIQQVKRLREVSEMAAEEESLLRLIAAAVLPNASPLLPSDDEEEPRKDDSLPPVAAARDAVSEDFVVAGPPVEFDRCYVFKGAVPQGRSASEVLAAMQQRVVGVARNGKPELFLLPAKEEDKSLLVMMLDSDLPEKELPAWQWFVWGLLLLTTLFAANTTSFSVVTLASNSLGNIQGDLEGLTKVLAKCLPTAAGILATVAASETARRAAAARFGVELTPPFLLPAWPLTSIGCLGAVTRRLSPAPNRDAEFAMSFSAALAGLLVAAGFVVAGIAQGPEGDGIVNLNYQLLPVILKVIIRPFLGTASVAANQADPFADPLNIAFPANPLLIGGLLGVIMTSLSLLPIGRLDGGVLARLALGNGLAGLLGFLAWGLLAIGSFAADDAGTLYLTFGICAIVWQSGAELPPREALSDIDSTQKALAVLVLFVGFMLSIPGWAFPTM